MSSECRSNIDEVDLVSRLRASQRSANSILFLVALMAFLVSYAAMPFMSSELSKFTQSISYVYAYELLSAQASGAPAEAAAGAAAWTLTIFSGYVYLIYEIALEIVISFKATTPWEPVLQISQRSKPAEPKATLFLFSLFAFGNIVLNRAILTHGKPLPSLDASLASVPISLFAIKALLSVIFYISASVALPYIAFVLARRLKYTQK